jgi:very-short-patch-repair endonuclease
MPLPYESRLTPLARELRKKMTDAERKLWYRLNRKQVLGAPFYRQKPIGVYIVDFYCPSAKLVVEVDGGHHFYGPGKQRDDERDSMLTGMGLKVLRVSDRDVLTNLDGVVEFIWDEVRKGKAKSPLPPFSKGG